MYITSVCIINLKNQIFNTTRNFSNKLKNLMYVLNLKHLDTVKIILNLPEFTFLYLAVLG